ncbi:MAG: hypothetical protein NPIRA02_07740 [Nitrospirales bacterium]|nr:MAG: hypothetical protein NPIRA02_07740 [Nitrospirales bacterium]
MPTNLAIDDKLVDEVKRLGGHTTKRAAVNEALREYVTRRKQKKSSRFLGPLNGIKNIITKPHENGNDCIS